MEPAGPALFPVQIPVNFSPELSGTLLNLYTLRLLEQGMFSSWLSSFNLISAYQLPKY